jgi:hypothetical protein
MQDWRMADARVRAAGGHLAQASLCFHLARFVFVLDSGQRQAAHAAAVRCLTAALPDLDPPGDRLEIPFEGAALAAVLRRPEGQGPHPVVLLVAGGDSAKEEFRVLSSSSLIAAWQRCRRTAPARASRSTTWQSGRTGRCQRRQSWTPVPGSLALTPADRGLSTRPAAP